MWQPSSRVGRANLRIPSGFSGVHGHGEAWVACQREGVEGEVQLADNRVPKRRGAGDVHVLVV